MNHSGDVAEQMVRMSLEGVEVAAKISGSAVKETVLLLIAVLKNKNSNLKARGKARLTSMLKSGKALEVFSVKEGDLQKFCQGAKQYGIVYCVLRNKNNSPDGLCDIMVKAEDAPKINRLVERFKFATVDKAKIETEIVKSKAEKAAGAEPEAPDKNDTEKLLDELLKTTDGKAILETATPKETMKNPEAAKTAKTSPSEPISESKSKSARGTSGKPSVREELREIKAANKEKEADVPKRDERPDTYRKDNPGTTHKQPAAGNKSKSKISKERT